jgi:hypothetical protein
MRKLSSTLFAALVAALAIAALGALVRPAAAIE